MAIAGPGTVFPAGNTTLSADGRDRTAIIPLVEVGDSGIRWAEPRDLDVTRMGFVANDRSRPSISSNGEAGSPVVLMDVSLPTLTTAVRAKTIRSLTTIHGGEMIDPGKLKR